MRLRVISVLACLLGMAAPGAHALPVSRCRPSTDQGPR